MNLPHTHEPHALLLLPFSFSKHSPQRVNSPHCRPTLGARTQCVEVDVNEAKVAAAATAAAGKVLRLYWGSSAVCVRRLSEGLLLSVCLPPHVCLCVCECPFVDSILQLVGGLGVRWIATAEAAATAAAVCMYWCVGLSALRLLVETKTRQE